jgi:hypothetical protein
MAARCGDSASTFGQDLLAYYFYLGEYARVARTLSSIVAMVGRDIESGARLDERTLDEANAASRRLSEIVGELIDVMWPTLNREYERAAREMFEREPTARAAHRAKVLSVLDPELVALTEVAYMTDMQLIYVARRLNALVFDVDQREIRSTIPHNESMSVALSVVRQGGFEVGSEWEPPQAMVRYSLDGDIEQVTSLVTLLRDNADAVEELRRRMAVALRSHFTISDLV